MKEAKAIKVVCEGSVAAMEAALDFTTLLYPP